MNPLTMGYLLGLAAGCGAKSTGGGGGGSDAAPANVTGVTATGDAGDYTMSVTIQSDETGCDQYADWWEVLDTSGALLYRRILNHSHPDDNPFTRSGGPVVAQADQSLVVRAHMHPGGYVGDVMAGTVATGFVVSGDHGGFAADVEAQDPQPDGCAF